MPDANLDDLVRSLQTTVGAAQRAIARRHQGKLERLTQLDASGRVERTSWNMVFGPPEGPLGERQHRLPLAFTIHRQMPQMTELAIEMDVHVVELRPSGVPPPPVTPASPAPKPVPVAAQVQPPVTAAMPASDKPTPTEPAPVSRLALEVQPRSNGLGATLHRLRILLTGRQPGAAKVLVNGRLLKTYKAPDEAEASGSGGESS